MKGEYAIVGRRGSGEDLSTSIDVSSLTVEVPLAEHSAGVREYVERFARSVGLPELMVSDLSLAGWLHDVGKADPRFQTWLCGGDEIAAMTAIAPLAKSSQNPRNAIAIRRARERAGYPRGGRHEVQSLAMICDQASFQCHAHDWDLVQHLVVSHHGFGRPFVPFVADPQPVQILLDHDGLRLECGSDHKLDQLGSGIPERFWLLVRRYGWWGLAWLETILRLADHRRSEFEQRRVSSDA
jgi:CRISPR-associated endonuclease/helicase Cas3